MVNIPHTVAESNAFQISVCRLWPGDKLRRQEEGETRWATHTKSFFPEVHDIPSLAEAVAVQGFAISSVVRNNYRTSANFISSQHLGVDFDQETYESSLEGLQEDPFIAAYAAVLYETPSSTPDKPRSRAVFILDQAVTDPKEYRQMAEALLWKFGGADPQCKDVSRFYYGRPNAQHVVLRNILPRAVVQEQVVGPYLTFLSQANERRTATHSAAGGKHPPGWQARDFVANGAPLGHQRLRALSAARSFLLAGYSVEETADALWRGLQRCEQDPDKGPWTWEHALFIAEDLENHPLTETHQAYSNGRPESAYSGGHNNGNSPPAESPTPLWGFPNTDLGNAERLIALHGHNLLYCWEWRKWLIWDGSRWNPNIPAEVGRYAGLTVRAMYAAASSLAADAANAETEAEREKLADLAGALLKWARQSETRARLEAMIALAQNYLDVPLSRLDSRHDLLNCLNGTVHLPTGSLREHSREDLITKMAPAAYTRTVPNDCLWLRFNREALPDEQTRRYVQKLAGYSLSGQPDHDVVVVLHGPGGTGKSTYGDALRASLGEYAASADIGTFTTKRDPHAPQPDLARLAGRRLVVIPEAQESGGVVALLKAVSGGDAVPTRSHHQETFDLEPTFTLWLRANKRPRVPDDDTGLWRRIREIPFRHKFEDPDESIRRTLRDPSKSGSDILSWAVEGYLRFLDEGLEAPEEVIEATKEYREEMDPLLEWLEEKAVITPNAWTSTADLLQSYQTWALKAREPSTLGRKNFSLRLAGKFQPSNRGSKGGRGFLGLRLLSDDEVLSAEHETTPDNVSDPQNVGFFDRESRVEKNLHCNRCKRCLVLTDNTSGFFRCPECGPVDADGRPQDCSDSEDSEVEGEV
jgi:putative DNA primase/helicase